MSSFWSFENCQGVLSSTLIGFASVHGGEQLTEFDHKSIEAILYETPIAFTIRAAVSLATGSRYGLHET
jgi:hypothetical protein